MDTGSERDVDAAEDGGQVTLQVFNMQDCQDITVSPPGAYTQMAVQMNLNNCHNVSIQNVQLDLGEDVENTYVASLRQQCHAEGRRGPATANYVEPVLVRHPTFEASDSLHERATLSASIAHGAARLPLDKLFTDQARSVILYGEAGAGKTVAVRQIAGQWSCKKAMEEFLYLFVISFRDVNLSVNEKTSAWNLLSDFCSPKASTSSQVSEAVCRAGAKVLLLFDGFDEYVKSDELKAGALRLNSIDVKAQLPLVLHNLLIGRILPAARRLITSRPAHISFLPDLPGTSYVEVLGFGEEEIERFFNQQFIDSLQAERALRHVRLHQNLYRMCSLPICCQIICQCLTRPSIPEHNDTPITLTQIYFSYVEELFKHFQMRSPNIRSFNTCLQMQRHTLEKFAHLARDGLKSPFLNVFYMKDLEQHGITKEEVNAGCLVYSQTHCDSCLPCTFSFSHLSILEFFAALAVLMAGEQDYLSEVVQQTSGELLSRDEALLTFLCGMLSKRLLPLTRTLLPAGQSEEGWRDAIVAFLMIFTSRVQQSNEETPQRQTLWLLRCIFETQIDELAKKVASVLGGRLYLFRAGARPEDCVSLAFVLRHCCKPFELDLRRNQISDSGIDFLLPQMSKIGNLRLNDTAITDSTVEHLVRVIEKEDIPLLQELHLDDNKLTERSVEVLSTFLEYNTSLKVLSLSTNNFVDVTCLADALAYNNSLQKLILDHNNISNAEAFGKALERNSSLTLLHLSNNHLQDGSGLAFANALAVNSTLEELHLMQNNMTDTTLVRMADVLDDKNCSLTLLCMSYNKVTDVGMERFAQTLRKNQNLRELHLRNNNLSHRSLQHILDSLKENSGIKKIWINVNDLTHLHMEEMCADEERIKCTLAAYS
uniref:nucleotide-binding oligomerization domain-containing protein 2-like isoform X2 n=1 Tax=Myxine glutinosa TaxID=7769 RepID=UPI00358ED720